MRIPLSTPCELEMHCSSEYASPFGTHHRAIASYASFLESLSERYRASLNRTCPRSRLCETKVSIPCFDGNDGLHA